MKYLKGWKIRPELLFLLVLAAVGFLYNYHQIMFLKPVGIHQWRSCVSAAFPVNLARGGSFFATQTNALIANDCTTDVTVVEFPLIYLIISVFYRIFGVHEFWFRFVQTVIGFMGLVYLFRLSFHFTRNWFAAAFVPLVIFTSPIYAFYLSGFIPDAVALSLTFGGFWYFLRFSENGRRRTWLLSMLFFLLAGLTKTSSLLPYLGIGSVALLEMLRRRRGGEASSLFTFNRFTILSFVSILVFIFAWYLYAALHYKAHPAYGGSVSGVTLRPIWRLDSEAITATAQGILYWFKRGEYHATWFLWTSLGVFIFNLFQPRRADPFLYRLSIMVVLGALAFSMLFFRSLRNHDYYLINNLFILVPVYLTFFTILSARLPRLYQSPWSGLVLVAAAVFLVMNCSRVMHFRYSERDLYFVSSSRTLEMYDIAGYLDEIGVPRDARVHCYPDQSINISLYLCDRKGLTNYSPMRHLNLEERLAWCRERGFDYLILGSREDFADEDLETILHQRVGIMGDTEIFRIR